MFKSEFLIKDGNVPMNNARKHVGAAQHLVDPVNPLLLIPTTTELLSMDCSANR
jgi:hypothetical protein